ncbi:MAG: hypothetical protein ACT4NX_07885 [Deltaproteobacteria bacterium]
MMNLTTLAAALIAASALATGCAAGTGGAGYGFLLIFILAPLAGIGLMLLKRADTLADSLYTIEGQIKRLAGRLDSIEEKIKRLEENKKADIN